MHTHRLLPFLIPILVSGLHAQDPLPKVGKPAPVFTAMDQDGNEIQVGGASKTWTVLAFYPKAMTGG